LGEYGSSYQNRSESCLLLLDFEKLYNRVFWGFLEGTLSRFGFVNEWIRGVSTLYSCASSKVLFAGGKASSFK
jgi:hypothetical protein